MTAARDEASNRSHVPPEPAAADELAVEDAVVEAVVEVAAAAAVAELLVDELEDDELPQAAAPAARTRQERMVNSRRTPASLARRRG